MKKNKCKAGLVSVLILLIISFGLGIYSEKIELEKIPYFVSCSFISMLLSIFILIKCYGK